MTNTGNKKENETQNVSEWVRKALLTGIGQVDKAKGDVVAALAKEVHGLFGQVNVAELLVRLLSGTTFEITASIKLVPGKDGDLKPEVVSAKVKNAPRRYKPKKSE